MKAGIWLGACLFLLCACRTEEGCIPDYCGTRDSSRFQTSELYPQFVVESRADGQTYVTARWAYDPYGSSHIRLVDGDALTVKAAGYSVRAQRCGSDDTTYCASIPAIQEGTEFVLEFERGGGRQNATSTGTLGKPFQITAPQEGEHFTYDDTLVVTWTDFGDLEDPVGVGLHGACTSGTSRTHGEYGVTSDDDGIATISLRDYADTSLDPACTSYDVTLTVSRGRGGQNDPAYAPSDECETGCFRSDNFVLGHSRSLQFVLTPN